MSLLKVEGVHSGYGEMEILHGVSIEVREGEIVSIIGPNGAGKSTLLKTIFGLLRPTKGQITFKEEGITGLPPNEIVRKGLCYVPQVDNIFPSLTVQENLEMGAFIEDDPRIISERMEGVYELFPLLKERRRQRVGKMSGGERQMVAIGRALMLDPKLLMLDEPSAALAPKLAEMIFAKIKEINGQGVSLLIVEQNAKESLKLAHRGYVLADGQNKLEGPGLKLLTDPEVGRLYLGG
jgi:branched-chain amino acid transport system ATP-binding protein/neutral amino acid transport system ATP-binding protein